MKTSNKLYWMAALLVALAPPASAAPAGEGELFSGIGNTWVLLGALGLTLTAFLTIFLVLAYITYSLIAPLQPQAAAASEEATPFWTWFWDKFNAAAPQSRERDVLLDHNYDGIQELDNNLPPWWKWGFYLSIVFAGAYLYAYHGGSGTEDVSVREYLAEVQEAEARKAAYLARMENMIDERNVQPDMAGVGAGQALYLQHCRACHGAAGEGGVGPNLTDPYWLHGGKIGDIFSTIKYGVPAKGMIDWKSKLTPKQIQQVASFILSMQGTNPPNGKAPQGELVESDAGTEQASL
jgi:cytochrome c oxidase cbb3-type subunit 3